MSAPERPSRQNLVVPPRQGNASVVLGAVVCGCLGFGLVWSLGAGRSRHVREPLDPAIDPAAAVDPMQAPRDPADSSPRDLQAADVASRAAPIVSDQAVVPAALEVTRFAPEAGDRPLSRFSKPSPEASDLEVGGSPPARLELPPESEISSTLDPPVEDAAASLGVDVPLADPEPLESRDSTPDAEATGVETTQASAVHPDAPPENVSPAPAEADELPVDDDPVPPGGFSTPPAAPVAAAESHPSAPPAAAATSEPAVAPFASSPGLLPADPAPVPAAVPSTTQPAARIPPPSADAVASPFAAAPPRDPAGPPQAAPQPASAEAIGQGRPGPLHLEGVQSPQLTVEKRGPREVQVGKAARYEILVRNVGAAVAHDVVLRDSVPHGAALVTTTPPAAPAGAGPGDSADELAWSLGELAPGGQARVVVEIMPQLEGEIGSVASVSFRAEASARSRATKPALAIDCTDPKPVLIGRDAGITITVSNPGSGVATGVVLEGFLPENVSHRSGSELEFDVGQLKPGESRSIELVLGTRGPGVHTARLAARADGGIEVQRAVRLEVTAPTLEIEVDMPVRRFLQRPATCSIAMINAGTAPARSVELAAQLPPGMRFVRANNAGWHDDRTHRVLWNLEELPPGETGTVEVVVMPVELGPQKITAAARSADGLADQVAHVCEVEGLAALVFEVVDSEDPIEVEGVTEYVVRVGNQGTKAATGVRLAATLLGDLEPVDAQGPAGHRVENLTVSFEPLAKLAPAEEAVYRVRAKGRSAGDQRVQVQITSEDHPAPITKEETTRVYLDR